METRSDAFVALPGGFGTLEEILEILTLRQLEFHEKAVVFLNVNGFFDDLFRCFECMYQERFALPENRELYRAASTPNEALEYIETFTPVALHSKFSLAIPGHGEA